MPAAMFTLCQAESLLKGKSPPPRFQPSSAPQVPMLHGGLRCLRWDPSAGARSHSGQGPEHHDSETGSLSNMQCLLCSPTVPPFLFRTSTVCLKCARKLCSSGMSPVYGPAPRFQLVMHDAV